jgi:tRNA-dihydrouridine synthase A
MPGETLRQPPTPSGEGPLSPVSLRAEAARAHAPPAGATAVERGLPRPPLDRRLAVAPMLDRTDRHERYQLRLLSRRALLYSEMVTTGALLRGDPDRALAHDAFEQPVALQLGGSEPAALAACARLGERSGYAEINLNVGCPSERVRSGAFGACLMAEPETVASCVAAMRAAVDVPVTVKTRIGIDDRDSYGALVDFVGTVAAAGCGTFIVHARKAWLKGLSPAQNRTVPPLRYDVVYRLKHDFPALEVVLNGGVTTLEAACGHLERVDGVMIGRAAYDTPYLLSDADRLVFGDPRVPSSRREVLAAYSAYAAAQVARGVPLSALARHVLGLFHGLPGARAWRRAVSEEISRPGASADTLLQAARTVRDLSATR